MAQCIIIEGQIKVLISGILSLKLWKYFDGYKIIVIIQLYWKTQKIPVNSEFYYPGIM